MDYSRIYIELMERASNRDLKGYSEKHHIVPKCMGGDDKPRNIAVLTPEEHYLAHLLLVKIYPDNSKLVCAANMMTVDSNGCRMNNKRYKWVREKYSANKSISQIGNKYALGKKHSKETKIKMSKIKKANPPLKGKFGEAHPMSKFIQQIDRNTGNIVSMFGSIREAARAFNLDPSTISAACRGKSKTAGGFMWRFAEDL